MNKTIANISYQLFKRNLLIFRRVFFGRFFDTTAIFFTTVIVFGYFMTKVGLGGGYGPFILIGSIASFGLFDVLGRVSECISDIEGERTISHLLTMPLSSGTLFSLIALFWGINATLVTFPLFFIGKLILFNRFDFEQISLFRLIPMFLTANLFYGFFSLWLTGVIRGTVDLGSIYCRYINPIFMFGAYFYSWKNAFALDHLIGYVSLINPMVYIMEGMRSATLGPSDYIPFWICPLVLWGFIFLLGWHGTRLLKKKLDCL